MKDKTLKLCIAKTIYMYEIGTNKNWDKELPSCREKYLRLAGRILAAIIEICTLNIIQQKK